MDTYRALPRIANSDLTEFRNILLFGQLPRRSDSPALAFGTQYHHLLLTARTEVHTGIGAKATQRMLDALRAHATFQPWLANAAVETVYCWDDELTGLPCKGKLDMFYGAQKAIADVKTTSASTQEEFLDSCLRYGYDRQLAYYADGCRSSGQPVQHLVLFGVQKQKPHKVFVEEWSIHDPFIDEGRKKYARLLRSWQQQPYTPSSWQPALFLTPESI